MLKISAKYLLFKRYFPFAKFHSKFFRELKSIVNDVRVLRLTDDLKYRHPNDIEKLTAIGEELNGTSINT